MNKQPASQRINNFDEVALGFSEEEALKEARGCLLCKKASCIKGCPVDIDIPGFIKLIKEKKYCEAADKIRDKNNLPAICGRVCPQEDQCERACVLNNKGRPIRIGYLERFVADWDMEHRREMRDEGSVERRALSVERAREDNRTPNASRPTPYALRPTKIAVIGSGPAGLTASADLAKMGYDVTLFEAFHKAGGVLVYGIPEFRLPKSIVAYEVDYVKSLGVAVETDVVVGRTVTIDGLKKEGFQAFFVGTGAGLPHFMGIEGENLNGVYSANEFLTRTNLMKAYLFPGYDTPISVGERIGVIGGGNVAMDSARCAKRLGGKEVVVIYRRTEREMPARIEEVENAKEEGIRFEFLANPTRILGKDGWISGVECIKNTLGEPDGSGRRRPVPIKGSEYMMKLDTLVCAIGQGPNPLLLSTMPELRLTKEGKVDAQQDGAASLGGVFAGGDIVSGDATVIWAMGSAKRAAAAIDLYLKGRKDA